jgi:hypothetical protein
MEATGAATPLTVVNSAGQPAGVLLTMEQWKALQATLADLIARVTDLEAILAAKTEPLPPGVRPGNRKAAIEMLLRWQAEDDPDEIEDQRRTLEMLQTTSAPVELGL